MIAEKTQAESQAHDLDTVTPKDVNDTPPALAGPEGNVETLPNPEPRGSGCIRWLPA